MKTQCTHCHNIFKAPDEYKGRNVKCPKCNQVFQISEFNETPANNAFLINQNRNENNNKTPAIATAPNVEQIVTKQVLENDNIAVPRILQQVSVNVPTHKSINGFGIAALVLGIIACLTCWIPFIGLLAIPLGVFGALFGFIGILASAIGRRSGVGLPIAGTIISIITIVVSIAITGSTSMAVAKSLKDIDHTSKRNIAASSPQVSKPVLIDSKESDATAYINNIQLYDFQAKYYESYVDGKIAGVEFKLKNMGKRTLKKIKAVVYFKDAGGNVIAEENYFPVLVSDYSFGENKPLKAGYIWQLEKGKFLSAKSVPSEWAEGNATIKITEVELEKE